MISRPVNMGVRAVMWVWGRHHSRPKRSGTAERTKRILPGGAARSWAHNSGSLRPRAVTSSFGQSFGLGQRVSVGSPPPTIPSARRPAVAASPAAWARWAERSAGPRGGHPAREPAGDQDRKERAAEQVAPQSGRAELSPGRREREVQMSEKGESPEARQAGGDGQDPGGLAEAVSPGALAEERRQEHQGDTGGGVSRGGQDDSRQQGRRQEWKA